MSINYLSSFVFLVLNFCLVHGQDIQYCHTHPAKEKGICITLKECPRLQALLQPAKDGDANAFWTIKNSTCSLDPPTVCCEPAKRKSNEPPVLPADCGTGRISDFVVGGKDASWFPWMVVFRGTYNEGSYRGISTYFCGGSLINDRFILTAAHCMVSYITIDYASVGELIISTDPDTHKGRLAPNVQHMTVADAIIHENYGDRCTTCNDIAIVRLFQPVEMHEGFVSPICLPFQPKINIGFSVSEFQGKVAKAAGWGTSNLYDPSSPGQPDHLQEVDLRIQTTQYCQQHTPNHPPNSTICAGIGDGRDTCKGDSGGPLMLTNEIGTRYFLVGLTSFGPRRCGSGGTQGVYTHVHHYLSWIQRHIS